jgi:hypothetical protein
MTTPMNITFEVKIQDNLEHTVPVTFYHIDAIHPSETNHAVIISGGKEWHATSTYPEIWDKIKKHLDENSTR